VSYKYRTLIQECRNKGGKKENFGTLELSDMCRASTKHHNTPNPSGVCVQMKNRTHTKERNIVSIACQRDQKKHCGFSMSERSKVQVILDVPISLYKTTPISLQNPKAIKKIMKY
jgi:hypothetical protein